MKKIIFLTLILIVILAGGAVYYFYFWESADINSNTNQGIMNENVNSSLNVNSNANNNINSNQNTNLSVKTDEETIKEICFTFAERYGSYSSTNGGQNLLDLKSWMTAKMRGETDDFIVAEKNKAAGPYLAFFTKVLSQSVSSLTSQIADCQVSTQRAERNETQETASYTQNLLLKFIKEKDAWQVSQAVWQEKT